MKNQLFLEAEEAVNQRKLDVTLRRFTADRLSEEQRQIIETALGYQRQCCIVICPTAQKFLLEAAPQKAASGRQTAVLILFGSLETLPEYPAAALVYRRRFQEMTNTVYLYIP